MRLPRFFLHLTALSNDDAGSERRRAKRKRRIFRDVEAAPSPPQAGIFFRLYWDIADDENILLFSDDLGFWTLLPKSLYRRTGYMGHYYRRLFWLATLRRLLKAMKEGKKQLLPSSATKRGALTLAFFSDRIEVEWEQVPTWGVDKTDGLAGNAVE